MICPGFVDPRYPRFTAKQFHDKLVDQGFHLSCTWKLTTLEAATVGPSREAAGAAR